MGVREMAQALGRRGGRARAQALSRQERLRIAALGGRARRLSLLLAQRIDANCRFAAAVRLLRGPQQKVTAVSRFDGPLPGVYSGRRKHGKRPLSA